MRQDRIMVTVSPQMRVALRLLAGRSGLSEATQATVTLRQALDRTINSAEGQEAIRTARAGQTARDWREGVMTDHYVEQLPYTKEADSIGKVSPAAPPPIAPPPTPGRWKRSPNSVAATPLASPLVPEDDDPPWSDPAVTGGY